MADGSGGWTATWWLAVPLVMSACLAGCVDRDRVDADCEWRGDESAAPLELRNGDRLRHLTDDALVAEDLAIRYADTHRGHRSGHFAGVDEYARTRERCMGELFGAIASSHGVTPAEVRDALGRRRALPDLAVMLSFAVLYAAAASGVARWILGSLTAAAGWAAVAAVAVTSAVVSTAGMLVGELWSGAVEMLRVGNGHLSYRADRIPWGQHRGSLFFCGVLLFWAIAALTSASAGVRASDPRDAERVRI
jgi:hypothetical protein